MLTKKVSISIVVFMFECEYDYVCSNNLVANVVFVALFCMIFVEV